MSEKKEKRETHRISETPFFPSEHRSRTQPVMVAAGSQFVRETYKPLLDHVLTLAHIGGACLRHFQNGYVFGDVVFECDGAGLLKPIENMWQPQDRPSREPEFLDNANAAGISRVIERAFFLGSAGSSNYGHWLVDDLPKALAYGLVDNQPPFLYSRFSAGIDRVKEQTLEALGVNMTSSITIAQRELVRIDNLFFVDPISLHPILKSRTALSRLRDKLLDAGDAPARRRRLFIDRKPDRRNIINFPEILSLLDQNGFEQVFTDELSFKDQVALFASAETIIGIMGAAMTNIIFVPEDCKVFFLAPNGWQEPFYWDLCDTIGLPYTVCFGDALNTVNPESSDFSLDPSVLARVL